MIVAALVAPIGIAAGLGAVAWGERAIRGANGVVSTPTRHLPTSTTVAPVVSGTSATTTVPTTTPPGPPTTPKPAVVTSRGLPPPPAPPSPPPPRDPGGPSLALAQSADCIQAGDTNHVVASVRAPAGLRGVELRVVHSTDGTTFNGPMDGDGATYQADLGPFGYYPDPQTVTWTVTVTDRVGRAAVATKEFAISPDPCP